MLTGYLAAEGLLDQLLAELGPVDAVHDRLVLKSGPPVQAAWAQNTWHDVQAIAIESVGDANNKLRAIQRNWMLYAFHLHRRAALIEAKLPVIRPKPLVFPTPAPTAPLGSWTLLNENTVLAAARCSSPFPHGEARFVEDRLAPPNRAYLKLWEALTLAAAMPGGSMPRPGERCLDLGASPGGWTWVLQQLGARVIAVDKAPLDPAIARLPNVETRQMSAFALDPAKEPPADWLCSDVVCYPSRLLGLVQKWMDAGKARNFVCTLKFQGPTDHDAAREFAAMPGSRLLHLFHNKHELTWIRLGSPGAHATRS
jgi:23S rRNA (cytidine2498-2'-O)-methyltransferase